MFWAAVPEEVETAVVLTCMKEAKRLVDMAYKERRERWGTWHFPAPGLSEKELDMGTSWVGMEPLSVCQSLCL